MTRLDILLLAEDPSAANYAALLLPAFARQAWSARLYASAIACGCRTSRGVECTEIEGDAVTCSHVR